MKNSSTGGFNPLITGNAPSAEKCKKFVDFNISEEILKAVSELGFKTATPIQSQAIPEMLLGHDVIGQASTGTGKTAAFGIPAIEKVYAKNRDTQVIVLCPTRELAMQVAVEFKKLLKYKKGVYVVPVYGGQPISRQLSALRRGAQVVVGTPGRTLDHIERGTLRLDKVKMVVLDEADEMLNMGFRQDIERILRETPKQRETALFSATMSQEILQLTKRYQKNPKLIKVAQKKVSAANVDQSYFEVDAPDRKDVLAHLISLHDPKLAIVFCNTKRKVDKIAKGLIAKGYRAGAIHGGIKQAKRDIIMSKFRKGRIKILVATDVAARGIDVSNVEIVFNYEIPKEAESYVHRIGRTGRAGKRGRAFSLITHGDFGRLRAIERYAKAKIEQQLLPSFYGGFPSDYEEKPVKKKKVEKKKVEKKVARDAVVKSNIASDSSAKKEKKARKSLKKKANKVFGKIEQSLNDGDQERYLQVMETFIDKNCSADGFKNIAAALLKMLIEVDRGCDCTL